MLSGALKSELFNNCRYDGFAWITRCRENHCSWGSLWDLAMKTYVAKHGPAEDWFDDQLINTWENESIDREMFQLEQRKKILAKKKHRIVVKCKT